MGSWQSVIKFISQILNYSAIQLVSKLASPGFILEHSLAGNRSAIILVSQWDSKSVSQSVNQPVGP